VKELDLSAIYDHYERERPGYLLARRVHLDVGSRPQETRVCPAPAALGQRRRSPLRAPSLKLSQRRESERKELAIGLWSELRVRGLGRHWIVDLDG
jgi:hypothetical protein